MELARSLYDQVVAKVVRCNVPHAWDHLDAQEGGQGCADTAEMRGCRQAWTELSMFPKCVLRQHKRGQRETQSFNFTKALLLRWQAGERESLWAELPDPKPRAKKRGDNLQQRQEACMKMAGLGRPGPALQRLVSPGLANTTMDVKKKLLPSSQLSSTATEHLGYQLPPLHRFL